MAKHTLEDLYVDAVRTQYIKNDPDSALKKLHKCREALDTIRMQDTPLMFRVPARIQLLEAEFADAQAQAQAGILFFADDYDLILILAACQIELGALDEALKTIDNAMELIPDEDTEMKAIAYIIRGDLWGKQRRYGEQIAEYRKAVGACERFPLAFELLGHTYLEMAKYDLAREAFKRALSSGVPFGWSHLGLGIALKNLGDFRGALTEFFRVIDHFREPALLFRAYRNLGSTYYRKRELVDARRFYAMALEVVSRDIATLCDLSVICVEKGDFEAASDFLSLAMKQMRNVSHPEREVLDKGIAALRAQSTPANTVSFHRDFKIRLASKTATGKPEPDPTSLALSYFYCGLIFESQEKYADCKVVFERAEGIFDSQGVAPYAAESRRHVADIEGKLEAIFSIESVGPSAHAVTKKADDRKRPYVNFSKFRRLSIRPERHHPLRSPNL
ncbi:MAG: tetratricopeptide repeat protein [Candidatus Brocadiia bacterium]